MSESLFDVKPEVVTDAKVSQCGTYRYWLTRVWDDSLPRLGWVMLNPSTADADVDDATIRRLAGSEKRPGFARRWGFGGIIVRNLYALRSTDPKALVGHPDPVGPENDDELALAAYHEPLTMLAWGANAPTDRSQHVAKLLWMRSQIHGTRLAVLGWTKSGMPRHPLYVCQDQEREYCDEGELFDP